MTCRVVPIATLLLTLAPISAACGSSGDADADDPTTAAETETSAAKSATEAPEPETFEASGVFVLHGTGDETFGWNKKGSPCEGQGPYAEIVEGAQVVITSSTGEAIALGELGPGSTVEDNAWYQCHFQFSVSDVPVDGTIYGVEVAGRGSIPFALDEADQLALELGA